MINQYSIVRFESIIPGQDKKFPVDDWDVQKATNLVNLEKYKRFWFERIESDINEEPGKLTVKKTVIKKSGNYFIDAFVETLEDIRVKNKELASKFDSRNITNVVCGINNEWSFSFNNNDKIVDIK